MEIKYGELIAKVNSLQQLLVDRRSEWQRVSEDTGEAFVFVNATYDYDANDTIILVRNEHPTKNMYVQKMRISGDTETIVSIQVPNAPFTAAGTAIVGQALNRLIDKQVTNYAVAYGDETGNTQGDIVDQFIMRADSDKDLDYDGALIIKPGDAVGVDFVSDGAEAYTQIWAYWK